MANPAVRAPSQEMTDYYDLGSLAGGWSEGLLMLMYHVVEPPPIRQRLRYLYVDATRLRLQLRELLNSEATFISPSDAGTVPDRRRRVVVTFDDGFNSVVAQALPVLRELGVPAITYIVAGQLGGANVWDRNKGLQERPLMSRSQILEWIAAGYEIGAHTMTHRNLATLTRDEARKEIFESKKVLEDLTGRPVRHFCYPYGGWNPAVRDLVIEAGYETACTVEGGYNFPDTDPFTLYRHTARYRYPDLAAWAGPFRSLLS